MIKEGHRDDARCFGEKKGQERLKILHLLHSNSLSGAEKVALGIAKELKERHTFLYCSPDGPIRDDAVKYGIEYRPVSGLASLHRVVREFGPEVVHAHDFRAGLMAATLPHKIRVISHLHQNPTWAMRRNLRSSAYAAALTRFESVLLVSGALLAEFAYQRRLMSKAMILPNAVSREEVMSQSHESATPYDLLFVGNFRPEKEPLAFVRIVAALRAEFPDLRAAMIGTGELDAACRQEIEARGLSREIELLGFQENPFAYMRQAKLVMVPSRWEGFGLVALESMLVGTPVLCTPIGGLRSLVVDGVTGAWCRSVEDFVASARALLCDADARREMGIRASQRALEMPDRREYAQIVERLYVRPQLDLVGGSALL